MLKSFLHGKKRKIAGSWPKEESDRVLAIERWLQEKVGEAVGVPGDSVDPSEPFTSYGLDSMASFTVACDLADWLGRELPAALLWEYPTIVELSEHLAKEPKL